MSLKQNKYETNKKITPSYAYNVIATKPTDIPRKVDDTTYCLFRENSKLCYYQNITSYKIEVLSAVKPALLGWNIYLRKFLFNLIYTFVQIILNNLALNIYSASFLIHTNMLHFLNKMTYKMLLCRKTTSNFLPP